VLVQSALTKLAGDVLQQRWRVLDHLLRGLVDLVGRDIHVVVLDVVSPLLSVLYRASSLGSNHAVLVEKL
jgi:hypothetical protein